MTRARRLLTVLALAAALVATIVAWLALVGALLWSSLTPAERETLPAAGGERLGIIILAIGLALALAVAVIDRLRHRYVVAPNRLLEQAQVAVAGDAACEVDEHADPALRGLAAAVNALVAERAVMRQGIADQVRAASHEIERERSRLAALMSELAQSVVVCNLDGRILLYNSQARLQFQALSQAPDVAGGTELIGLGRSIYAVLDARLIAHALEEVCGRLSRGAGNPSMQFIAATPAGQLLRVSLAPVPEGNPGREAAGFVLLLENITRQFEEDSLRDQHLLALAEGTRASLGSLQTAVAAMDYPDVDDQMRALLFTVIRDEVGVMAQRLDALESVTAQGLEARWPLEVMRGLDLLQLAQRRLESGGVIRAERVDADESIWLRIDSFSLLQALTSLSWRLSREAGVSVIDLRLARAGSQRVHLDLIWSGLVPTAEVATAWELAPMETGAESLPLSVRDVVMRHGGEFWFERERAGQRALFRFRLPLAPARDEPAGAYTGLDRPRPVFYDFDLFRSSPSTRILDERPLAELTYTVFDTETTGLNPSLGDEIIQIGA
ncbi:MAG: DNA polymerase III subunit epsilon, partial [Lautropia sp.]